MTGAPSARSWKYSTSECGFEAGGVWEFIAGGEYREKVGESNGWTRVARAGWLMFRNCKVWDFGHVFHRRGVRPKPMAGTESTRYPDECLNISG
jgi:hypothetical protein